MIEYNISSWIIIDTLGRVLLIKRKYNKRYWPDFWAYPWWHIDNNESSEEAAMREIKEEVWLDFEIKELFEKNTKKINDEKIHFNRYLWNYSWNIKIQEKECDWYWWFTYNEIQKIKIDKFIESSIKKLYKDWILK